MADERITVLVENTAGGRGLLAEHGLSFWIEWGGKRILFDTGQGKVLAANARRLGVRLASADAIVLSHGHYDHTGGLGKLLGRIKRPRIYAHPGALAEKYSRNASGGGRPAGVEVTLAKKICRYAELVPVVDPIEVVDGLWLTGPVPRQTEFENTGGRFFTNAQCSQPDDLVDDQAAFFDTPAGVVVVLGCAHAGVINTLRYVASLTSGRPIHTVIGGMHLLTAGPERMDKTVVELRRLDVRRLMPCHCTGFAAMARLWHEFPDRYATCRVGSVVELGR